MRTPQRTIPSASTTAMLRILRRQSRQCPFVDFVRAECLLVLLQPETVDRGADVHALLPAADTSTSVYHIHDYFHARTERLQRSAGADRPRRSHTGNV